MATFALKAEPWRLARSPGHGSLLAPATKPTSRRPSAQPTCSVLPSQISQTLRRVCGGYNCELAKGRCPPGTAFSPIPRRRVLVVEDEYLVAQDVAQKLGDMGVEVSGPVPRVAEALALLASGSARPDAAILDVNLGGEMVFPVVEILRKRGVPLVFVTGYDPWTLPYA